ncbi:hypothetical protein L0244_32625, partial [bacterium]|nr:hypothetical protein [bacterium]
MAWILAADLIAAEIDGRQVVPVVIDGDAIKPPAFSMEKVAPVPLEPLATLKENVIVFIVENVPFSSKTRMKALLDQIELFTSCKFIIVTKASDNIIQESDFEIRTASERYILCDIPFVEIAHFVQKNFSMSASEAEVVALRLHDTFSRFDLSAHPTYFACIPRETLTALLQANRRSELIQLAVAGFLSFVVAEDRADIALRRTTRERFLRRLVVQIRQEKKVFDQPALVEFTQEYSKKYDFSINPMEFINTFVEQGIIHFDGTIAKISLPFVETYLLAVDLSENLKNAEAYFALDDEDFDFSTFDIYAEIQPSQALVEKLLKRLSDDVLLIRSDENGSTHVLLSNEISPIGLGKPERLR